MPKSYNIPRKCNHLLPKALATNSLKYHSLLNTQVFTWNGKCPKCFCSFDGCPRSLDGHGSENNVPTIDLNMSDG